MGPFRCAERLEIPPPAVPHCPVSKEDLMDFFWGDGSKDAHRNKTMDGGRNLRVVAVSSPYQEPHIEGFIEEHREGREGIEFISYGVWDHVGEDIFESSFQQFALQTRKMEVSPSNSSHRLPTLTSVRFEAFQCAAVPVQG